MSDKIYLKCCSKQVCLARQPTTEERLSFKVPLVPLLPMFSVFINIYLMMKLSEATWIRFAVWLILGVLVKKPVPSDNLTTLLCRTKLFSNNRKNAKKTVKRLHPSIVKPVLTATSELRPLVNNEHCKKTLQFNYKSTLERQSSVSYNQQPTKIWW